MHMCVDRYIPGTACLSGTRCVIAPETWLVPEVAYSKSRQTSWLDIAPTQTCGLVLEASYSQGVF